MEPEQEECAGQMAWRKVAASAYQAYANSVGNKNLQGNAMPAWEALPQSITTAWEAAARHADLCQRATPGFATDYETCWIGWVPPHLTLRQDMELRNEWPAR